MEPWPPGKYIVIYAPAAAAHKVNYVFNIVDGSAFPNSNWSEGSWVGVQHLLHQKTDEKSLWGGTYWWPTAWMVPLEIDPDEESLYDEKNIEDLIEDIVELTNDSRNC